MREVRYIISYPLGGPFLLATVRDYGGPYDSLHEAIEQFRFFRQDLAQGLIVPEDSLLRGALECAEILRCITPRKMFGGSKYLASFSSPPLTPEERAVVVQSLAAEHVKEMYPDLLGKTDKAPWEVN